MPDARGVCRHKEINKLIFTHTVLVHKISIENILILKQQIAVERLWNNHILDKHKVK